MVEDAIKCYIESAVLGILKGLEIPQLTEHEAIKLAQTSWWKDPRFQHYQIALFQLCQDQLCMDWDDFVEAMNFSMEAVVLGRAIAPLREAWKKALIEKYYLHGNEDSCSDIVIP